MSTVPITCPNCGAWLRVAVQACRIDVFDTQLRVHFDMQNVAHTCKETDVRQTDNR